MSSVTKQQTRCRRGYDSLIPHQRAKQLGTFGCVVTEMEIREKSPLLAELRVDRLRLDRRRG
jgi:hypothetical protein